MKGLFGLLVCGVVMAIGFNVGDKLWDDVLEDKVDNLKERLVKKD